MPSEEADTVVAGVDSLTKEELGQRFRQLYGRQPVDLTADRLTKHGGISLAWADQRRQLGFA